VLQNVCTEVSKVHNIVIVDSEVTKY